MKQTTLEPGLLRVLQITILFQVVGVFLTRLPIGYSLAVEIPLGPFLVLNLFVPLVLLVYVSVPWCQHRLGSAFVPIALLIDSANVILEKYLRVAWLVHPAQQELVLLLQTVYLWLVFQIRLMKRQREQRQALAAANQQLAQYAATTEQLAVSQERNRLARELHDTLAHSLSGVTVVDPSVAGKLFTQVANCTVATNTAIANTLSQREREVLRLVAKGLSNTAIARQLFLSEGTVRNRTVQIVTLSEGAKRQKLLASIVETKGFCLL